jgi:hypothetical protein
MRRACQRRSQSRASIHTEQRGLARRANSRQGVRQGIAPPAPKAGVVHVADVPRLQPVPKRGVLQGIELEPHLCMPRTRSLQLNHTEPAATLNAPYPVSTCWRHAAFEYYTTDVLRQCAGTEKVSNSPMRPRDATPMCRRDWYRITAVCKPSALSFPQHLHASVTHTSSLATTKIQAIATDGDPHLT